jgi:hypothetical protein
MLVIRYCKHDKKETDHATWAEGGWGYYRCKECGRTERVRLGWHSGDEVEEPDEVG